MARGLGVQFLIHALRNRGATGALWPSGRPLVEAMVRPALARSAGGGPLRILEVGAGVGPVSSVLARRLLPGDTLDIVELDATLCMTVSRLVEGLPGVACHHGDVLEHVPAAPYDVIVSGLPLANFPSELVRSIYVHLFGMLRPGSAERSAAGRLVSFHHLFARQLLQRFATARERARVREIVAIERALAPTVVASVPVPRNVPPAVVIVRERPPRDVAALITDGIRA
jgi:phospholipid N-methyltransferase